MKSRGLRVSLERGEELRRTLAGNGLLRSDLGIARTDNYLILPIGESSQEIPEDWGELVEHDFEARPTQQPLRYRDLLSWPEPEKELLPRSFDVIGDIVLIRLPTELAPRKEEVGEALLEFVPGVRVVGLDHGVHGPERRRTVERIAGGGPWKTVHRENGIAFDVDVELAYFSPRLAREHALVARDVATGDRVYDLCCGVGPFTATIAREGRASHVTAVDSNPNAIALLRATLSRGIFATPVVALASPLEEFLPDAPEVERVVLNLPHEGIKYVPSVANAVTPGGRLYYYEVTDRTEITGRGGALRDMLGPSRRFDLASQHVVHPYSPGSDLVAYVLERGS